LHIAGKGKERMGNFRRRTNGKAKNAVLGGGSKKRKKNVTGGGVLSSTSPKRF